MKLLIDLQHPADIHFFRNVIARLRSEGHTVRITGRDKDIVIALGKSYGMEIEIFGIARKGLLNLGREFALREYRLWHIIREFRPDLMMSFGGTYISLLGKLMGVPVYVFYDSEHATLSNTVAYPFATCVYVPRAYYKQIRWRHERFNGYKELAYLHPKYFQPDPSVLKEVGLEKDELFTIVRFVGWGAAHDIGHQGFTVNDKIRAIKELGCFGRVLISSEGDLPDELKPFELRLNVSRIHHLMAYAALIFGESGTMSSEGAVLGVPAVYVNPLRVGYLDEQEQKYGLAFRFQPEQLDQAIAKGIDILSNYCREEWQAKGQRLLEDTIDVTDMLYQIAQNKPYFSMSPV